MLFYISLVLLGLTSLTTQVVFLREFLNIFSGNDLSIGIILSIWMISVGSGANIFGRIKSSKYFHLVVFLFCLLLPSEIFLMRILRTVFQTTPFEMLSIIRIIFFSIVLLGPICFLFGACFVSIGGIIFQLMKKLVLQLSFYNLFLLLF